MKSVFYILLLLCLTLTGCASKAQKQAQIRRAYAAGEEAARAQMEQQMQAQQQQQLQALDQNGNPKIRIYGSVQHPVLDWTDGLTLDRALVEAVYVRRGTPTAITIIRNNQPLHVDIQRLLQGQDYPLYPGDVIQIQD